MTFFIKKNSTLPKLKYALSDSLRKKYDISDEMLENCAVTFSMYDADSGVFKIANKGGELLVNESFVDDPDDAKYTLAYKFSLNDSSKAGVYYGEFKLDFLGDHCGKISLPNNDKIRIVIQESSTKTTVIS